MRFLIILFAVSVGFGSISRAQEFEGRIQFAITYSKLPAQMAGMEAMLPEEMTVGVKGDHSRVDQALGMGMKQVVIVNNKTGKVNMLMDMMGRKMSIEMTEDELDKKEKKVKPEIKYMDGTKVIAGYDCKKAEITMDKSVGAMTVYYTDQLPSGASRQFKGLKGFPLEYEVNQQGMTMVMSAKKIEKASIPDADFQIPSGYEKMSMEQFSKAFGGM